MATMAIDAPAPPTLYAPTAPAPKAPLPPMVDSAVDDEATRVNIPEPEVLRNLTNIVNAERNMRVPPFNDAPAPATKASVDVPKNGAVTVVRSMPTAPQKTVVQAAYSPAPPAASPAPPPAISPVPPSGFGATYVMEPMRRRSQPAATAQIPVHQPTAQIPVHHRAQTIAMANPMQQQLQQQPTGYSATYMLDPQAQPAAQPQAQSYPPPQDPHFMPMHDAHGDAMQGQPYGSPPYMQQQPMNPADAAGSWPPNANAGMQPTHTQPPEPQPKKLPIVFIAVAGAVAMAITGIGLIFYTRYDSPPVVERPEAQPVVTVQNVPPPPPIIPPPVVTVTAPPREPDPPPTQEPAPPVAPVAPTPIARPIAPPTPVGPKPVANPNEKDARARLAMANGVLAACKQPGGTSGTGTANVTFGPDGNVIGVFVNPPYGGTKEGDCVAGQFRRVKVNPFDGGPMTINNHSFSIP